MGRLWAGLLLVAAAAPAMAGDFEDRCEAVRAKRLPALIELATWCNGKRLLARRDALARQIVALEPGNAKARRWLEHRRAKDGTWSPPKRPVAQKDRAAALGDYPAQHGRLVGPIAAGLFAALGEHEGTVTPGDRERLLVEIIALDPGGGEYREAHDEVKSDAGRWELRETVRGRERRVALAQAARKAIEDVGEAETTGLPSYAAASPLRFIGAWRAKGVVVTATQMTTGAPEAKRVATRAQAAPAYLKAALGIERRLAEGLTFHLLGGEAEARSFIPRHPRADASNRAHWSKFSAGWIGTAPEFTAYNMVAEWRVEDCVAAALDAMIHAELGLTMDNAAWAHQGFHLRMAWDLVGTRLTYSRRAPEYGVKTEEFADHDDLVGDAWFDEALAILQKFGPADMVALFGEPINAFTKRDAVVAHGIAAYYLEGRPSEARRFLAALGAGESAHSALEKVSDLDPEALRLRVVRWLRERKTD